MTGPNYPPSSPDAAPRNVAPDTAERVGSAAMGGNVATADPEAAARGAAILGDIQQKFRSGQMRASGGVPPATAHPYRGDVAAVSVVIDTWCRHHPSEDVKSGDLARRMKSTWLKHALSTDNPREVLRDERALTATLATYQSNAAATRKAGFGLAEGIALYNSPDEVARAVVTIKVSKDMTVAHANMYVKSRLQDVATAVGELHTKVVAGRRAVPDPKVLPSGDLQHIARGASVEDMAGRAKKYEKDYTTLRQKYAETPAVTETRIRQACAFSGNPDHTIYTKLREADRLDAKYGGTNGLTKREITEMTFKNEHPEERVKVCIRSIAAVKEATGGVIPDSIARDLCIRERQPIKAATDLVDAAAEVKARVGSDPVVQATVRDREYIYLVRTHGAKKAEQMVPAYADNVQRAQAAFAGDPKVTQEVIRHASLEPGSVVVNVRSTVAMVDRLAAENAHRGVNRHTVQRAVLSTDNAQGTIDTFVDNRNAASAQYGDRLPASFIDETCQNYRDPVERIRVSVDAVSAASSRYGATLSPYAESMVIRREVQQGPAGRDERIAATYAKTVMEDMRANARAGLKGHGYGRNLDAEFVVGVAGEAREWLQESGIEGLDAGDLTNRFARNWAAQTRNNPELQADTAMAKAAFTQYARDAAALAECGFRNPGAVAQYNNPDTVIAVIQGVSENTRTVLTRGHTVVDLQARAEAYQATMQNIELAGVGREASDAVKRAAVTNYRDPVEALRRYDENQRELPRIFGDEVAVNERVVSRYAMRPDAAGEIRDFLRREATLDAMFGDNPDFDLEVRRNIAMNFDTDDPEVLRQAGEEWNQRYQTLRYEVDAAGVNIEAWALREAAMRDFDDPAARLRYAAKLTADAQKRGVSVGEARGEEGRGTGVGDTNESKFADQSPEGQSAEDVTARREEAMARAALLRRLTAGLSDAERELVAYKFTGDVVGVDEEDLRRRLGTENLDEYLEELLARMRRQAEQEGVRNSREAGRRTEGSGSDRQTDQEGGSQDQASGQQHGRRSDEERQQTNDDLEARLRQQQERMRSDFNDRFGTLTPAERDLMEYRLRGQTDPQTEEDLKRRLGTDDLDGYYAGLRNYLGLEDQPEQGDGEGDDGQGRPNNNQGGEGDDEPSGPPRTYDGPSNGGPGNGGAYTAETASPRGIAIQLLHIVEQFPIDKLRKDPEVVSNVILGVSDEANEFNSAHVATAISVLTYAQEYIQQAAQQLNLAAEYAAAFLSGPAGTVIQINLPQTIIDPGTPQPDSEYVATLTRMIDEYTRLVETTRETLAGIIWTADGSIDPSLTSADVSVAGSILSMSDTTRMFMEAITAMNAHAVAKKEAEDAAKLEREREEDARHYDEQQRGHGDQNGQNGQNGQGGQADDQPRTEQW